MKQTGRAPRGHAVTARGLAMLTDTGFTLPALFRGFQIQVAPVANKEYAKVLKTSNGSRIILATGTLKTWYTNLQTGKTIVVNRSGPGKVTVFADGSEFVVAKGPGGLILAPPDAQRFGLPAGNITSLSFHGHVLVRTSPRADGPRCLSRW